MRLPWGDSGDLDFSTNVGKADIFISMDTTGSFNEEIEAVQAALTNTIIPGIQKVIPDAAFGVGRFEDMPVKPFGSEGDTPYELLQPITETTKDIETALGLLQPTGLGGDVPEAGYEALYQWAAGTGISDLGLAPFTSGGIGGVGFRRDALPIILQISDAKSHLAADYTFTDQAHTKDETISALNAIGARLVGINSLQNTGTVNDPRDQFEELAIATKAIIPPDEATGKCLMGLDNAPLEPVDIGGVPSCPVVFNVAPDGSGLGSLIVDAVEQLATLGTLDISTRTVGRDKGILGEIITKGFDTSDFIKSVRPVAPAPTGSTIDKLIFRNVTPGSKVTFEVKAFNDFQPHTEVDQLFDADIEVLGDLVALLDVRNVFIIVPRNVPPVTTVVVK